MADLSEDDWKNIGIGGAVVAAAALGALVLWPKAAAGQTPPPPVTTVTFIVEDSVTTAPVANALVTLEGDVTGSQTTGSTGTTTFAGVPVGDSLAFTASAPGYATQTSAFTVTTDYVHVVSLVQSVVTPALTTLALSASPTTVTVNAVTEVTIVAHDQNGAPFVGAVGSLLAGGTTVLVDFTTGADGVVVQGVSFGSAGTYTIAAVSGSVTSAAVTITVVAAVGPPVFTSLAVSASTADTAVNTPVDFTVSALDQNGNVFTGGAESGELAEGGVLVTGAGWTTNALTGKAAPVSLTFPSAGTYSITAVSGTVTSPSVTVVIIQPIAAPPETVATSTNLDATKADCNHKLFFTQGLYWLWFLQDNDIVYITSPDTTTWSPPTTVAFPGAGAGEQFDVFLDVATDTLYYVQCLSSTYFNYGVGMPTSAGTISWTTTLRQVPTPTANGTYGVNRPTIRPDSLGNIYVALEASVAALTGGNNVHIQVYELAAGTWTLTFDYDTRLDTAQAPADWMGVLGKLMGGAMTLYFGSINGGQAAFLTDWDGTAWSPPINMSGAPRLEPLNGGGVTLGNTLYWAGFGFGPGASSFLGFFSHTYGDTAVPALTKIAGAAPEAVLPDGQGCISSNGANAFVIFYSGTYGYGSGADRFTVYYRVSTDLGALWGPESVLASGEAGIQGKTLQCTDIAQTGAVQVAWTSGTSSPYAVRFATLLI